MSETTPVSFCIIHDFNDRFRDDIDPTQEEVLTFLRLEVIDITHPQKPQGLFTKNIISVPQSPYFYKPKGQRFAAGTCLQVNVRLKADEHTILTASKEFTVDSSIADKIFTVSLLDI